MPKEPILTTAEAAHLLNTDRTNALALLRAAHVPFTRAGQRGAFFWNAAAVHDLAAKIKGEAMSIGGEQ